MYQHQYHFRQRLGIAVLLLIGLAACSSGVHFEKPRVDIVDIKALPSKKFEPTFQITLKVVNPNRQVLNLQGVFYTLKVKGKTLLTGASDQAQSIPGYGEGYIELQSSISLFQLVRFAGELLQGESNQQLPYEFSTKIDIAEWLFPIHLTKTGNLSGALLRP